MYIFEKNRIGKFYIDKLVIEKDCHRLEELFRKTIIIRAEMLYHRFAIEYIAICPEFQYVEQGVEPPEYNVILTNDGVYFERK